MLPFASLACFVDDADVMCVEVVQLVELVRGQAYDEQRNTAMSSCAGKPTVRRAGEQRDHARVATNSMPSAHRRVRCTPMGLRVGEPGEIKKVPPTRLYFTVPLRARGGHRPTHARELVAVPERTRKGGAPQRLQMRARLRKGMSCVPLVYAAGGGGSVLACARPQRVGTAYATFHADVSTRLRLKRVSMAWA